MEPIKRKCWVIAVGAIMPILLLWHINRHADAPLLDLALSPQSRGAHFNPESFYQQKALPAIRDFIHHADLPISSDFSSDAITHKKIFDINPNVPRCELSLGPSFWFDVWGGRVKLYNNKLENCEHRVHADNPQSRAILEALLSKPNLLTKETALLRATQIFTNLGYRIGDFHPALVEQAYYHDQYRRYPKLQVKVHPNNSDSNLTKAEKNSTNYLTPGQSRDSLFVPLPIYSIQWDWKDTGQRAWETNRPTVDMFISGATSNLINFSDHVLPWQVNEYRLR